MAALKISVPDFKNDRGSSFVEETFMIDLTEDPSSPGLTLVDEQSPVHKASPSAGERLSLSDFTVARRLGKGAFGTVHLVTHASTGTRAALKVMKKYKHSESARGRQSRWELMLEEQHALRRVNGTSGLLDMLGSYHDSHHFYILSSYYPGGDLQTLLHRQGRFTTDETRFYMAGLVLGMEALRNMGIVHRDIKPANILIDAEGHLVISDFGLAKMFEGTNSQVDWEDDPFAVPTAKSISPTMHVTNSVCGTPEFMAPEVHLGEEYSYPADMWSVGVIFFEMLVGHLPWERRTMSELCHAVVEEDHIITEEEEEEYSLNWVPLELLDWMLEKFAAHRPTPSELKTDLFFKIIDWENLAARRVPAPWIPDSTHDDNASATPAATVIKGSPLEVGDDEFPSFYYASPLLALPAAADAIAESPSPADSTLICASSPSSPVDDDDLPTLRALDTVMPVHSTVLAKPLIRIEDGAAHRAPTPPVSCIDAVLVGPEAPALEDQAAPVPVIPVADAETDKAQHPAGDRPRNTIIHRLKLWAADVLSHVTEAFSVWSFTSLTL